MTVETKTEAKTSKYIILMRTDNNEKMLPLIVKTVDESGHPPKPGEEKQAVLYYPKTPAEHLDLTDRFQAYKDSGYISTFEFNSNERNENNRHFFFANTSQREHVHFIVIPREAYGAVISLTGAANIEKDDRASDAKVVISGKMKKRQIFDPEYPQLFATGGVDLRVHKDRVQFEILLGGNWSKYALCRSYPEAEAVQFVDDQRGLPTDAIAAKLISAGALTLSGENLGRVEGYVEAATASRKKIFLEKCEGIGKKAKSALDAKLNEARGASSSFWEGIVQEVGAAKLKIDQVKNEHTDLTEIERVIDDIQQKAFSSKPVRNAIDDARDQYRIDLAERQKKREDEAVQQMQATKENAMREVQQMINNAPTFSKKEQYVTNLNELLEEIRKAPSNSADSPLEEARRHKKSAEKQAKKENATQEARQNAIWEVQQMINNAPTYSEKIKYVGALKHLLKKIEKETDADLIPEHLVKARSYEVRAKEKATKENAADSKASTATSSESSGVGELKHRKAEGGGGPAPQSRDSDRRAPSSSSSSSSKSRDVGERNHMGTGGGGGGNPMPRRRDSDRRGPSSSSASSSKSHDVGERNHMGTGGGGNPMPRRRDSDRRGPSSSSASSSKSHDVGERNHMGTGGGGGGNPMPRRRDSDRRGPSSSSSSSSESGSVGKRKHTGTGGGPALQSGDGNRNASSSSSSSSEGQDAGKSKHIKIQASDDVAAQRMQQPWALRSSSSVSSATISQSSSSTSSSTDSGSSTTPPQGTGR
jgi:hypothetical protein